MLRRELDADYPDLPDLGNQLDIGENCTFNKKIDAL
jgi:hypothetical protein